MKKRRSLFQKAVSLFTGFLLVFQSLTPGFFISSQISAQEITPTETVAPTPVPTIEPTEEVTPIVTPTETVAPTPIEEVTPTIIPSVTETPTPIEEVTPTIVPTVETTPTENTEPPKNTSPPENNGNQNETSAENTPTPTITPTPTPEVIEQTCEQPSETRSTSIFDWSVNEFTRTAETTTKVELGVKYEFPENHDVSIAFTCLPKDIEKRTSLKIQEININELKLPSDINAATDKAYDITTGMADGTFTYTITLPKTENTIAEVSYIEKTIEEVRTIIDTLKIEEIKPIEVTKTEQQNTTVKGNDIDHMTIFFVTNAVDAVSLWSNTLSTTEKEIIRYSDNNRYENNGYWPIALEWNTEYIEFTHTNTLPSNITVTGANIIFEYQRSSAYWFAPEYAKIRVWDGSHWQLLPDNLWISNTHEKTFTIPVPLNYVNTASKLNNFTYQFKLAGAPKTYIDRAVLDVSYLFCGDNIVNQTTEECDGSSGVPSHAICNSSCKLESVPYCGDSIINGSETCDGTNLGSNPATDFQCSNKCDLELLEKKVTICHASDSQTNPYIAQEPNKSADVSGHDGHNGGIWYPGIADHSWGDIIPPFYYIGGQYLGQNWTTEGQAIWNNGCAFTNGTLIVKKTIINDNGGTKTANNFSFTVNDGTTTSFESDGQNDITVTPGIYSVTELPATGYATTYDNCSNVAVGAGQTKTCTITNNDIAPKLTVTKIVKDSTEPITSFPLFVNTTEVTSGQQNAFSAGNYTVSETNKAGYTAAISGDCATDGTITLLLGEVKSCTITNTLQESVITGQKYEDADTDQIKDAGETGQSGWTIFIDANGNNQFDTGELSAVTDVNGNYTLSGLLDSSVSVCEVQKTNWDTASRGLCRTVNPIPGQTITNIDFGNWKTAYIIIAKDIVPDTAGGWFDMYLDSTMYATVNTDWTSDAIKVAAGTHTVREVGANGTILGDYATHFTGDCNANGNVTVSQGQTKRCTIVNTKIPVYTGSSDCPTEKPVKKLVSSYTISSTDADGQVLSGLAAGNYLFEATGTYVSSSGGNWKSDAGYSSNNNWSSVNTQYGINGTSPNYGAHALLADLGSGMGIVKWGTYNATHQYYFYTATPANPQFAIGDRWSNWYGTSWDNQKGMSDNSGAVTLNVYTCESTGTITIDKATAPTGDEQTFDFTITKDTTTVDTFSLADRDAAHTDAYEAGHYTISEATNAAWEPGDISCQSTGGITNLETHASLANPPARVSFDLAAGGNVTCTFNNIKYGSVEVTKFNDANDNGVYDREETTLSGWDITLTGQPTKATDETGVATFSGLSPSTYYLDETIKDGWEQTVISCSNDQELTTVSPSSTSKSLFGIEKVNAQEMRGHPVNVDAGQNVTCVIGNHYIPAVLQISKENNITTDIAPGSSVLYTLTVKSLDNTAYGVKVTDLLPKGFAYRSGSWTASSNTRGALALGEPTYHSPGTWDVGNIEKDEVITLTLTADVATDEKPGLYKDIALAYGCQQNNDCAIGGTNALVADAIDPGQLNTTFVGTEVNIVKEQQDSKTLAVSREEKTEGSVLGATTDLPSTGANSNWIILAISLMVTGLGAIIVSSKMRRYHA